MNKWIHWAQSAPSWQRAILAVLLGALTVLGFAPYYLFWLPWLSLAILLWLWQHASTAGQVFKLGFAFGLGLYCAGIYWIYISLHTFGGMPWWFAGFSTFCLCAFMALFPALAGYLATRLGKLLWTAPVLWALSDWVRGWIFTGFPWLTLGYSQAPDSPLAGFLPVMGVYGVSALVMLVAANIVAIAMQRDRVPAAVILAVLLIGGSALTMVPWTRPVGPPVSVALLQGNIGQTIKWSPEHAEQTLKQYLDMVRQAQAQLIVLPETALPVLVEQLAPAYLDALKQHARQQQGDLLVGVVESRQGEYFNSALSLGASPSQAYSKSHLVPFGEYIPLKSIFGWIYRDWLHMPLSDLSRGTSKEPLLIAGQKVGVNICYEDVFGEEIARQLPQAELLVNISNDAWYGQSFAAEQHMQFSQVRALETGRMVLRSTNTGATAIIDKNGQVLQHAVHDQAVILTGEAQSYRGQTPYVWWRNWAFLVLSVGGLLWIGFRR
ncbi:Apolipoprotein N-acyltransferase [Methylophilus rhizosphaerae]|uniref:Apolipoprotein N-acyltransferase n=1 Tax=Methylophilus rhizosphaerae TaxID=492660 RepID=A0A1G9D3D1_9PROT|nr:apolipoprotein N-acyltransferase [Methylophilus rhizosphaerae]SDK58446.1 Apolipoprotein N-acyltransferase [Methylophilus rhizosphaerae]